MEPPGTLFDQAAEYTQSSGANQAPSSRRLLPVTREPNIRAETGIARSLALVHPDLRLVFRRLVTGQAPWPLYLHGPVGTGKTMAALCLLDHVEESYYRTVSELADNRMAKGTDMDHVGTVRLAVLDEIGAREKVGDLVYEVVKEFADRREKWGRVAVYVSNLDVPAMARLFDDRVADRLTCGTLFELTGKSRRRETKDVDQERLR